MEIRSKEIKMVPIHEIRPDPRNRNKHSAEQLARLRQIIEYQGFRNPLIVSSRTGMLVAGHARWACAKALGMTEVPAMLQDFESAEQEYAAGVSDNSIASWSELDLSGINTDLAELGPDFDIDLLGIRDFVLEPADKLEPQCDEDAIPEHAEPRTRRGDVYQLGRHRLMCGDSTSIDVVERLMAGEKADMVFTDPPYGMSLDTNFKRAGGSGGYKGKDMSRAGGNNYRNVAGDHEDFCPELIGTVFAAFSDCAEVFLWGADYYAEHIPERKSGSWVVWDKVTKADGEQSGVERFHGSNFELCWSKAKHKRDLARIMHKGFASVENDKRTHPTQKPVALAEWFFARWGTPEDRVVDLFGGSGSTIIACEKTNRRCFMMELDPKYVDIIVARWEAYTGLRAQLLNSEPPDADFGQSPA